MDKKINDDLLENITGGTESEPEEFNWREKGYPTPKKDQCEDDGSRWKFETIADKDGYYTKITGGTSLPEIEIEIEKLNVMIDALKRATDHTNQSIMNMIINVLKECGEKPAIALAEKLFANDEKKKKQIIDIINSSF